MRRQGILHAGLMCHSHSGTHSVPMKRLGVAWMPTVVLSHYVLVLLKPLNAWSAVLLLNQQIDIALLMKNQSTCIKTNTTKIWSREGKTSSLHSRRSPCKEPLSDIVVRIRSILKILPMKIRRRVQDKSNTMLLWGKGMHVRKTKHLNLHNSNQE